MNRLQQLLVLTRELEDVLNGQVNAQNRDDIMGEVHELLDERKKLLDQITPPFTADERLTGQQTVALNEQIQQKMDALFDALKLEMKQSKKQKKSNRSYLNPYENVKTADGMYMDSRN
ncbi:flagellar protein FliT [Lentibacillus salinarum]|uniref:Flagellar protein FliT n=1 Tax=Lentibacillus salinarum TaxID=446820 RepID=A0ABW3ZV53_9BACI